MDTSMHLSICIDLYMHIYVDIQIYTCMHTHQRNSEKEGERQTDIERKEMI